MSVDDLLTAERRNLEEIELKIASYGAESRAPLDLVNLRNEIRAKIATLEAEKAQKARGGSYRRDSKRELMTSSEYDHIASILEGMRTDLADINVKMAVINRDMENMKERMGGIDTLRRDVDRIKAHIGINGDDGRTQKHVVYLSLAMTVLIFLIGVVMVLLTTKAL